MSTIKKLYFCIFILFGLIYSSNIAFSQTDINSYQYLKLKITNKIEFKIIQNPSSIIKRFNLDSYFFPQTFNNSQYLNSFSSSIENYIISNNSNLYSLKYSYAKNQLKNSNSIINNFQIESVFTRPKITSKVSYPITLKKDFNLEYLSFGGLIDTNSQIKLKASQLAEGEDDVFIIASKIAKWLREDITYDLSTINELPNQKSSEVFLTKRGVCKEITNLYISMLRSIGIPARIVTGYAYTNSQEIIDLVGSNWGGHAWAEVLIGDSWVPFDLTYNQYGFVDATHIVLAKSAFLKSSSVSINASGYNFDLVPKSLIINNSFQILEKKENLFSEGFEVTLSGIDKLGFDSYGYIKVNVINSDNFYKILFLSLSNIKEVEILNSSQKMIIFKPNEKKEIYFKFKIKNVLNKGFIYTFPFSIYNSFLSKNFSIKVETKYPKLKYIDLPIDKIKNIKKFSKNNLDFKCNLEIKNPTNQIICLVKNTNNYMIDDLSICLNDSNCKNLNLNLNEKKLIIFKTDNYNEILNYNFNINKSFGEVKVIKKIPKISFQKTINKNKLTLNTLISNFENNTILNIYIDGKKIKKINSAQSENIFKLVNLNNKIKLELVYNTKILDEINFNINIDKKDLKTDFINLDILKKDNNLIDENKNFISIFIEKFLNFISSFKN